MRKRLDLFLDDLRVVLIVFLFASPFALGLVWLCDHLHAQKLELAAQEAESARYAANRIAEALENSVGGAGLNLANALYYSQMEWIEHYQRFDKEQLQELRRR